MDKPRVRVYLNDHPQPIIDQELPTDLILDMTGLVARTADPDEGSPEGQLHGESLRNTLAVFPIRRGGLPGYRLKRVLEHIGDHLADHLSLSHLAAIAAMSAHYFAELFKQSTGEAPHRYVLRRRIERAKQNLCDPRCSIIQAGLDAGFQNPSHFARVFRQFVGITPSRFRAETQSSRRSEHGVFIGSIAQGHAPGNLVFARGRPLTRSPPALIDSAVE